MKAGVKGVGLSAMNDTPPGWSLNSLTASSDDARKNQFATFYNKPAAKDLVTIDRLLRKLLDGHIGPTPNFPMQFLLRSHSCFRAAAACAMGGRCMKQRYCSAQRW